MPCSQLSRRCRAEPPEIGLKDHRLHQWPEYDKYQAGTKRDIPVVLLSPR